jgi:hypothetical protein
MCQTPIVAVAPLNSTVRRHVELLQFLKTLHDRLLELARQIRFDKTHQVHFARIALYSSLIEFTGAIINLIDKKGRVAVPAAFRSFLEAAVELRNLNADPTYIEHMYASHMEHWLKVLNEAKTANPYLSEIGALPQLDELIRKDQSNLDALVERGRRPLNVFDRFQRAGMVEEYRSLYNFLSCDAHSNIRALITRHFEESGGNFNVVMYKDEPVESFAATLDSTAGLLLQASLETHKAFGTPLVREVEKMLYELEELRARA